jgi:hypothetical protein
MRMRAMTAASLLRGRRKRAPEPSWLSLLLTVLAQGERRDPAESLRLTSALSDVAHDRHDRVMTWLLKLGFLRPGAPHFCLTLRGRVLLMALRPAVQAHSPGPSDRLR